MAGVTYTDSFLLYCILLKYCKRGDVSLLVYEWGEFPRISYSTKTAVHFQSMMPFTKLSLGEGYKKAAARSISLTVLRQTIDGNQLSVRRALMEQVLRTLKELQASTPSVSDPEHQVRLPGCFTAQSFVEE